MGEGKVMNCSGNAVHVLRDAIGMASADLNAMGTRGGGR